MTIRSIVTGRIWKPGEERQSANGRTFTTVTIAIDGQPEGQPRFARVTGFGDEAVALLALGRGAAVAATGRLDLTVWTPEGKPPEVQMRLIADAMLTIAPERERTREGPRQAAQEARHDDAERFPV